MTFELSPMSNIFDAAGNPYIPHSQQNIFLDPTNLDLLNLSPAFPPAAHAPAMLAAGPIANKGETTSSADDIDDNSEILDPIEDHEFPIYFRQIGTPPRLFHSYGSYVLPVDSDETKVQTRACADMISLPLLKYSLPMSRGRKLNISCSV